MWRVLMLQLKPYVSYKVSDVTNATFTARELFNSTYAKTVIDDFNKRKLESDKASDPGTIKSSDNK